MHIPHQQYAGTLEGHVHVDYRCTECISINIWDQRLLLLASFIIYTWYLSYY